MPTTHLTPKQEAYLIARFNQILEDPQRQAGLYLLLNQMQLGYFKDKVLKEQYTLHQRYAQAVEDLLDLVAVPLEQFT